jgi:hypothetical protein
LIFLHSPMHSIADTWLVPQSTVLMSDAVYPVEPFTNGKNFDTPLAKCPNTILTPHIGGSTEEGTLS